MENQNPTEKRGRGRPSGSRNKPKTETQPPDAELPLTLETYFKLRTERENLKTDIGVIQSRIDKINAILPSYADLLRAEAESIGKQ